MTKPVPQQHGIRQSYVTSLVNTLNTPFGAKYPMIRLEISNIPVLERGQLVTVSEKEACALFFDSMPIKDIPLDVLNQCDDKRLVDLHASYAANGEGIHEYLTHLHVELGPTDCLSPKDAPTVEKLNALNLGKDLLDLHAQDKLDIFMIDGDSKPTGTPYVKNVGDRQVENVVRRYYSARVKYHHLVSCSRLSSAAAPDNRFAFSGEYTEHKTEFSAELGQRLEDGRTVLVTKSHICFGRYPRKNYARDKEETSERGIPPGRKGRGYVVMLDVGILDIVRYSMILEYLGTHAAWAKDHPTPFSEGRRDRPRRSNGQKASGAKAPEAARDAAPAEPPAAEAQSN